MSIILFGLLRPVKTGNTVGDCQECFTAFRQMSGILLTEVLVESAEGKKCHEFKRLNFYIKSKNGQADALLKCHELIEVI